MAAAVNNNLGSLLTNTYASFPTFNATGLDGPYLYNKTATCPIPVVGTDLAGSTYKMCQVQSGDICEQVFFACTALTAGALSVGLYNAGTLTVAATNSDHLFATSINCASAVVPTDERYVNLSITTASQRIWQLLGLSADPGATYDLTVTSTTGATAAGTIFARYVFSR